VLEMLQESWLAHAIGESQMITAALSSLHLIGFTLIMGSAIVSGLRRTGALLGDVPVADVTRPAWRALVSGLAVSASTGLLLFVPRAAGAAANPIFRVKLTLLASAFLVTALLHWRTTNSGHAPTGRQRLAGGVGLALWVGVALAGCAFILLE
jgi:hypothetical protein